MSVLGRVLSFINPEECDWYCDECGAYLNSQLGFTTFSGEWTCTECGAENDVSEDNIIDQPDDYIMLNDDPDMPEGCAACGGPYPNCTDSCKLFDE